MAQGIFMGAWSMGSSQRAQQMLRNDSPGPAAYEERIDYKGNSPKWSILGKNKSDSAFFVKDNKPAPGQYEAPTFLKISQPAHKNKEFVAAEKTKSIQRYYSSGYLNLPSSIETQKGFGFGYRFEDAVPDLSPGPTYNINDYKDSKKSIKIKNKARGFGFGAKDSIYKGLIRDTPGPGSYNPIPSTDKANGGNILFPKDERKLGRDLSNSELGPGSYNPNNQSSAKGCRILGRYKEIKKDSLENIGPGSYKIPEIKSPTAVRFVESKRQQLKNNSTAQNPSPFDYNPKRYPEAYRSNEGYRMGYAQRKELSLNHTTPGPGNYNIAAGLSKQGVIIATKLKSSKPLLPDEDKNETISITHPNYDSIAAKSPAFTFPQAPLQKHNAAPETGPGSYQVNPKNTSQKFSMGKAPRFIPEHLDQRLYFSPNIESKMGYIPSYLLKSRKEA